MVPKSATFGRKNGQIHELGFTSFYTNTRGDVGLTDGDWVGVTAFTGPESPGSYTDGTQGFEISDADGKITVTLDTVDLIGRTNPSVSVDYFLAATSWETSPEDVVRIWVTVDGGAELDLLNSKGADMDNLGIEASWNTLTHDLTGYT